MIRLWISVGRECHPRESGVDVGDVGDGFVEEGVVGGVRSQGSEVKVVVTGERRRRRSKLMIF